MPWTGIVKKKKKGTENLKWPDEAEWKETRFINQWPPFPCDLPAQSLFSVSCSLLSSHKIWLCLLVLGSISSQPPCSPLLLVAIIHLSLSCSIWVCSSHCSFCYCPAGTEAAAFPKDMYYFCHLLVDATSLSLLLKEWEQTNWKKETYLHIKHCTCTLLV